MAESSAIRDLKGMTKNQIYLVILLCFTNIINYMDRVGMSSVLVAIQSHFSIGDDQGGLLQTVLLCAFTVTAPFFGFLGDRYSRKLIILVTMAIWIAGATFGVFASKFWMLLVSRMVVGVGQSSFTTIAPTLFPDIVMKGGRTVLLSCFYIGLPVGCGLGYITCVSVYQKTDSWRYGLLLGPIVCTIALILICFARFPERGSIKSEMTLVANVTKSSIKEDFKYLLGIPSYIYLTLAFTCVAFVASAMAWWMPKCLYFGFQLIKGAGTSDKSESAFHFGLVVVTTGLLGILLGLVLSRTLRSRFPRTDPIICGCGLLIAAIFDAAALSVIAKSEALAFVFLFLSMLHLNLNWAISVDMLLYILLPSCRALGHGVHMFVGHIFGDCISPYIVGAVSEYFKQNYKFTNGSQFLPMEAAKPIDSNATAQNFHSLQLSLFIIDVIPILGATFFFVTSRFIVTDAENATISI